jgi:hypothetical protein
VVGLLAVVVAGVGLNVVVDTVRPEWRDPEWGWRLARVRATDRRPLVVAVGSSRTQMGLSPADLGVSDATVFNFGMAGAGPLGEWLALERLRAEGIHPDAVLIEVFPAALAAPGGAEHAYHDTAARLSLADVRRLERFSDDPGELRRRWWGERLSPWSALRASLVSHALPTLLPWQERVDFQWRKLDPHGWLPYPFETIADDDRRRGLARVEGQYRGVLREFAIGRTPDRALRAMLADLRDRGTPAVLYRMPEGPTFRGWYTPEARDTVGRYLAGLTAEYGVPAFDASDWLPEEAFADGHHLLRHGAVAFSRRFGREVVRPLAAPLTRDRVH